MKVSIVVPSKDGGEHYSSLLQSIYNATAFAIRKWGFFDYDIHLLINGNPEKPLWCLGRLTLDPSIKISILDVVGKAASLNFWLTRHNSDIIIFLDDDVVISEDLIDKSISILNQNKDLEVVGFSNTILPFHTKNIIRKFVHDVINVRSIKQLFQPPDPFLIGRALAIRNSVGPIPSEIINEDQYWSIVYSNNLIILDTKVYYRGETSLFSHFKRVSRIIAGRNQLKKYFGNDLYCSISRIHSRKINREYLYKLSTYWLACYSSYVILRFITNKIAPLVYRHKRSYW